MNTITKDKTLAAALLSLGRLSHVSLASNKTTDGLRSQVAPGEHKGRMRFELEYDLNVGEESEAEVAQSVPWKRFAGALLARMNENTREALVRSLIEDGQFKDAAGDDEAEELIQRLMGMTKKTVAGRITGTTTLTPLD